MSDDITRMAREAWGEDHEIFWFDDDGIERFEALVRADEREACAKRLEAIGCDHCAANIRARGHQPPATVADRLARHGILMPGDNP